MKRKLTNSMFEQFQKRKVVFIILLFFSSGKKMTKNTNPIKTIIIENFDQKTLKFPLYFIFIYIE
jgi:hypothetical protein